MSAACRHVLQGQVPEQQAAWHPGLGAPYTQLSTCSNFICLVVLHRESEEKLAKQAEEKALEKARQAGELVEDVKHKLDEVVDDRVDRLETASAEVLDLEEGTPESLGVMVAKVAVVSAVALKRTPRLVTTSSS